MSIARLRAGTGGAEISSQSNRLGDVVREVVKRYGITDIILTEDGEIRPWARVFVNGRSQELAGGLDTVLSEGDRVALVFPYAEAF